MGFDASWISPVVDNMAGGYHGYWAQNWDGINANFGTPAELTALVTAAHAAGIWVMVDVVANHSAPVGTSYFSINPLNQASYYHPDCDINWND